MLATGNHLALYLDEFHESCQEVLDTLEGGGHLPHLGYLDLHSVTSVVQTPSARRDLAADGDAKKADDGLS